MYWGWMYSENQLVFRFGWFEPIRPLVYVDELGRGWNQSETATLKSFDIFVLVTTELYVLVMPIISVFRFQILHSCLYLFAVQLHDDS